mmetsp:Transcript_89300/g.251346  ORF Transcript_89300/g.251346 Transcript_89300/m.251346 type:complete len:214 (+) Transcript_89300:1085-1726(+)
MALMIIVISMEEWNSTSRAFSSLVRSATNRGELTSALATALEIMAKCAEVRYTKLAQMRGSTASTKSRSKRRLRAIPLRMSATSCMASAGANSLARAERSPHQASSSRPARAAAVAAFPRPSPSNSLGLRSKASDPPTALAGVPTPRRSTPGARECPRCRDCMGPAAQPRPNAAGAAWPKGEAKSPTSPVTGPRRRSPDSSPPPMKRLPAAEP